MEEEAIEDFPEAVATIHAVVGRPVVVRVDVGDRRPYLGVRGKLQAVARADHVVFRVGQAGYLQLHEACFTGGSRSSIDGGDYWGITVEQGPIHVHITDDKNAV